MNSQQKGTLPPAPGHDGSLSSWSKSSGSNSSSRSTSAKMAALCAGQKSRHRRDGGRTRPHTPPMTCKPCCGTPINTVVSMHSSLKSSLCYQNADVEVVRAASSRLPRRRGVA